MTIPKHIQTTIAEFFNAIEPLRDAYHEGSLSYVAIKHEGSFVLLQGYLYLNASTNIPYSHFASANIRAGYYRLPELQTTAPALIESILSGKINTPGGTLLFRRQGTVTIWRPILRFILSDCRASIGSTYSG